MLSAVRNGKLYPAGLPHKDKRALGTSEVGRVSAWYSPCKSLLRGLHFELFHSQASFPHGGKAVTVPGFITVPSDFQRKRVSVPGTFS